eukprot:491434-Prymnesium_polylepis.1
MQKGPRFDSRGAPEVFSHTHSSGEVVRLVLMGHRPSCVPVILMNFEFLLCFGDRMSFTTRRTSEHPASPTL